jgi:hypothetical protein
MTYDEAKESAAPVIAEMNTAGQKIAQKYGQKFRAFSFVTLMR